MTNSTERIKNLTGYLRKMRLPIMADRLVDLYGDPTSDKRSTLDILEEIVGDEYQSRRHNTVQRNLKSAKLSQPLAHIQEIDYSPSRQINREIISINCLPANSLQTIVTLLSKELRVPGSPISPMRYVGLLLKKAIQHATSECMICYQS